MSHSLLQCPPHAKELGHNAMESPGQSGQSLSWMAQGVMWAQCPSVEAGVQTYSGFTNRVGVNAKSFVARIRVTSLSGGGLDA